ncbi:uncharacterized protein LOC132170063 [Corylus avellana]|uniref:uncharacterized protein LOC132170063 n=1 Tax=Corylus avellana TaxID=13451 RepID=UPI00286CE494|nr:uncharacterized protein LOC132170063 [Corylus avellana]
MDWDDDGWPWSAEELDSFERDAFQKIAQLQRQNPNSSSSSAAVKCSHYNNNKPQPPPPQRQQELHQRSLPSKPTTDSSSKKVEALSSGSRALPSSITNKVNTDEPSMGLPKLSVKFFLHAGGHIASKFSYDQVLVAAFRKIPKATWNAKERVRQTQSSRK